MKKLPAFLNTPAKLVVTVGLCILIGEFLIMLLIEALHTTLLYDIVRLRYLFEFADPILLVILVSPALFLLIFRPMRAQQAELERQLDELRSFQSLSIGRELRMKELVAENAALRKPLSAEPAGDLPVTSSSVDAPLDAAEQHVATQPTEQEHLNALLFMLEDLEATRKQVEQAHQEWIAALDVVNDPIFLHDKEFRILRCNKAYQQCAGIPFKQIIGQPYYEVFPKADAPLPCCLKAMEKAEEEEEEEEVAVGDANYRSRSFSVNDEQGVYLYSVHILEDITESRRTKEEQRRSAAVNAALVGLSQYFLSEPQLVIEDASARVLDAAKELTGSKFGYVGYIDTDTGFLISPTLTSDIWDQCQVAGKSAAFKKWGGLFGWVLTHKESLISNAPSTDPRSGGIPQGHVPIKRFLSAPALAGEELMGQVSLANADHDYTDHDLAVVERLADFYAIVVQRVRSEKAMRDSEEKFRVIFDSALDGILLADAETKRFSISNPTMCRMLGYNPEELTRLGVADIHPQQDLPYVIEQFEKQLRGEIQLAAGIPVKRKDGSVFYADIKSAPVNLGSKTYLVGMFRDITERKQAEAEIQHANRALATLSAVNHNLVHATDETELLQAVCRVIVEQRSYRAVWVGYAQQDAEKTVRPMAQFGFEAGYLDTLQVTWADSTRGQGPTGKAVRSGVTQVVQDVANDPGCALWREQALKYGSASAIALPLLDGAETFGTLSIYAAEANAFKQDEIALLEEMADDLAFGIRMLRLRQNQKQHAELLRKSLEGTVLTIAAMVEMRDPYTAGHQRRVADLATAIAVEMGLPEEQTRGIHLAGTIHDLGKIQTPAEILSKPGKLSASEFNLIKDHPQNGYEILKGIDFPWPIAQTVLQHHERIDGSGYPQGLKGEAILLEARILAVADVVEAISAHRPYRPGLGIEMALEEITKQRGIYFDPQVVDACLVLFHERGYQLSS